METQTHLFTKSSPAGKTRKKKLPKQKKIWTLFIDGASRGNPGPSGAGMCIVKDHKQSACYSIYLGTKTNNQAEYLALALGIYFMKKELIKHKGAKPTLAISSDSELLVRQMRGIYKIKNPVLAKINKIIHDLLSDLIYTIQHVRREKNEKADALANKGIDSKKKAPVAFVKLLKKHKITI